MVRRNETIRRLEIAIYHSVIAEAAAGFALALTSDQTLPPLWLSLSELDNGSWKVPEAYEPIILRVMAEIVIHQEYELSDAQLRTALLRGAEQADRLVIESVPSQSSALTIGSLVPCTARRFLWSS
jgi:hypothetical protein